MKSMMTSLGGMLLLTLLALPALVATAEGKDRLPER